MPVWIVEKWEKLNRENQVEAEHYIERLLRQQHEPIGAPARQLGVLSDRFEFISDDFDAPVPEFREYM